MKPALRIGIVVAALCVVAMLVWQGVTAHGAPDPTRPDTSPTVAFLDIGILVFREGLLENARTAEISQGRLWFGLVLLGFTSLYREGFEVVLFLQSYHLRLGGAVVMKGALLGIVLTGMVAVLTFVLQQRLPYRKMLITTGILLGVVLLVMVGEQTQEMQLAHWISTTEITSLKDYMPPWMGLWFAVFPTVETLVAQFIAAVLVVGSYYAARHFGGGKPGGTALETPAPRMAAINA